MNGRPLVVNVFYVSAILHVHYEWFFFILGSFKKPYVYTHCMAAKRTLKKNLLLSIFCPHQILIYTDLVMA